MKIFPLIAMSPVAQYTMKVLKEIDYGAISQDALSIWRSFDLRKPRQFERYSTSSASEIDA